MTYPNIHKWVEKLGLFVCVLSHSLITWTAFFNVCFHVYCKYNSLLFHIFLLICVFVSIAVQLYGNSSIQVRSHCIYLKEEKRVPVKLGVVAQLDPARHGHKYSSSSIFYYIFHVKPDFYGIYSKTRRILSILFLYLMVLFVCIIFLFSGDLNTNVDFSDFIFVKIYSKFDVRKQINS